MVLDRTKFGDGYITEAEKGGKFIFTGTGISFDEKSGSGGAVPIRGYKGPWPVFGTADDSWEAVRDRILSDSDSSSSSGSSVSNVSRPRMMCRSTGRCRACPKKELHTPYCQPYGNSIPIECRPIAILKEPTRPTSQKPGLAGTKQSNLKGAASPQTGQRGKASNDLETRQEPVVSSILFKGFQPCGKDQAQETWDYSEFIALNLVLALAGLMLLLNRQRKMAGQHRAMLARRIGRL